MKLFSVFVIASLTIANVIAYPLGHPDNDAEVVVVPLGHVSVLRELPESPPESVPTQATTEGTSEKTTEGTTEGTTEFVGHGVPIFTQLGEGLYPVPGAPMTQHPLDLRPGAYSYFPFYPSEFATGITNYYKNFGESAAAFWKSLQALPNNWLHSLRKDTKSETRIVDGKKVLITENTFFRTIGGPAAIVKVRNLKIIPFDSNEQHTTDPAVTEITIMTTGRRDVEGINDSDESTNNEVRDIEGDSDETTHAPTGSPIVDEPINDNDNKLKKSESLTGPVIVTPDDMSIDLSAPHSSNDHYFDVHKWETFEDNDSNEVNKNDDYVEIGNLDEYDNNFPVDLSNDIAINQMLADQGAPFNPDAEIFNVHEYDAGRKRSQEQYNTENQSFEYMPYYYVRPNLFNRQSTNQYEQLNSSIKK